MSRIWNYRRVLRSPLFQPFRKVLRPLVRWVFASHLFVDDESKPDSPIGVNLKPVSLITLLLGAVLAPLILVLLLPLALILFPAAIALGMMGVIASSTQSA